MVTRKSATLGLGGDIEEVIGLDGEHSEICRFDLENPRDQENYKIVVYHLRRLREAALSKASGPTQILGAGENPTQDNLGNP